MKIVVVLPVCKPDFHLAVKWINWVIALNCPPFTLIVFCAASMEREHVIRLMSMVKGSLLVSVQVNPNLYERHDLGYAACANNEFRSALEMTEQLYPGRPTLWCEPDCIPIRRTWVNEIDAEYVACEKPFMGDFHAAGAIPHMTGNAVYSADWRKLAPSIATLPYPKAEQGFDTQCAHDTVRQMARSTRIQQIWMAPLFTEQTIACIAPSTALFHRDKSGTLIDVLAKRLGIPPIPLEAPIAPPTQIHRTMPAGAASRLARRGGVEIMYVVHAKDMEFLRYSLRSLEKFATGFSGITVVAPAHEKGLYGWTDVFGVRMHYFTEIEGRGMLGHMIQKVRADQICPEADYILHLDADCIVWRPMTPADYIINGHPVVVRERYAAVLNPARRYWQKCVHAALGFWPETEGMTRHPQVHIAEVYAATRNAVEQQNGVAFDSYVIAGQNKFPQSFAEWPTVHAIVCRNFADRYTFRDYDRNKDCAECGVNPLGSHQYIYRKDREPVAETWTHGGIESYRKMFDEILSGKAPGYHVK